MDEPNNPVVERGASSSSSTIGRSASPVFFGPNGLRAGWRLLIFLAILSALFSIVGIALRLLTHRSNPTSGLDPLTALLGEGLPLLLVLIATWALARLEGRSFAAYGLPARGAFGVKFLQGVIIGFAAISALLGSMHIAGAFHLKDMALHGTLGWQYAFFWAVVFVVVGLFEEFFFRGYPLFTLTTGISFWPAAIIMSLLFGYVHHRNSGETWVGALAAGLVGLLFCLLLRRTGNLWLPIGFHASWDWGETYFYGVPDSGQLATGHLFNASFSGPQWLTGGTVGPEGSYLCILLLVLLFVIFAAWFREAKYPDPAVLTSVRGAQTHQPAFDTSGDTGREQLG